MKLSLKVLNAGKGEGKLLPITLSPFTIGRDPACHLRPASPVISKRHCLLRVEGGKVFLRDLESTNGTVVNGEPLKGEVEVHQGDHLQIGPLEFQVVVEVPTPAKPKPRAPQPVPAGTVDDEAAAALLLEAQDESEPAELSVGASEGGDDPNSTTVVDLLVPPELRQEPPGQSGSPGKMPAPPAKKPPSGNTQDAAKALLEKYMRRPRG